MNSKSLSILGSTGSIGTSTLDVVREANARAKAQNKEIVFEIIALSANKDANSLIDQALEFRPKLVAIVDATAGEIVKNALKNENIEVAIGVEALKYAASLQSDMVMAAIVGAAGLEPTLEAVNRGARILLANKECLVSAGELFLQKAKANNAQIIPVDSEHNAIFQVLQDKNSVEKIILTASGGPFLGYDLSKFDSITPEQACKHPNWQMGKKISIDSATMMNKGLELIEAAYLFDMPENLIDIVVHPQSIIHSMVSYKDGSVLAQMGTPDMRIPISFALAWPERIEISAPRLDLTKIANLQFFAPDLRKFPALNLARDALKIGGSAPTLLNAANETAVSTFLKRNVTFSQISLIVEKTLEEAHKRQGLIGKIETIEDVLNFDDIGRKIANEVAIKIGQRGEVRVG